MQGINAETLTLGKFCFYAKKLEKLEGEEWVKGLRNSSPAETIE